MQGGTHNMAECPQDSGIAPVGLYILMFVTQMFQEQIGEDGMGIFVSNPIRNSSDSLPRDIKCNHQLRRRSRVAMCGFWHCAALLSQMNLGVPAEALTYLQQYKALTRECRRSVNSPHRIYILPPRAPTFADCIDLTAGLSVNICMSSYLSCP